MRVTERKCPTKRAILQNQIRSVLARLGGFYGIAEAVVCTPFCQFKMSFLFKILLFNLPK